MSDQRQPPSRNAHLERVHALLDAVSVVVEQCYEHPDKTICQTWQFAQLNASMWQLLAYAWGQPTAAQYTETTIEAADRRCRAVIALMDGRSP